MFEYSSLYDDKGTYIFRSKEPQQKKVSFVYKTKQQAKEALIEKLEEVLEQRQSIDISFIKEDYIYYLAKIAMRLPEQKREEVLNEIPENIANKIHEIIESGNTCSFIYNPDCVYFDMHEVKQVIHDCTANLTGEEIKEILDNYLDYDQDLKEELEKTIFLFEDIVFISDMDIQKILREIDQKELSIALCDAKEDVLHKFLNNMSDRAGRMLVDEIIIQGKCNKEKVLMYRHAILSLIRELEDRGDLVIDRENSFIV